MLALLGVGIAGAQAATAQTQPVATLKRLSLEQLLAQEVLLASRTAEPIRDLPAAVEVISGDAIRTAGAMSLPHALRLASNLHVAQIDSSRWAVSARGFNSVLANKLLVMVDGRTIYSPLFAGVFWDTQDVMLEDIDQIEVLSGPGGALWGANAVNGVINVRTRSARETQGWLATVGGGDELRALANLRYGGRMGENGHFRIYGRFQEREGTLDVARDDGWHRVQGGFRADWQLGEADGLTLQGDFYQNTDSGGVIDSKNRGANLLGRWSRSLSDDGSLQVQAYWDRVDRDMPDSYADRLDTFDLDFQHRLPQSGAHRWTWGANFRQMEDDFESRRIILQPGRLTLRRGSLFLQDAIDLAPDELTLTLGAKAEYNSYTDIEIQPSVRLAWIPDARQTYWAALSRALRTPARLDRDRLFPGLAAGGPRFQSEELLTGEIGARMQPHERLSLGATVFYHDYANIRSIEFAPPGSPLPFEIANGQRGRSYGIELMADVQLTDWWQVRAGLTELRVIVEPEPWSRDRSFGTLESVDANHIASIRSTWDLWESWEIWFNLRGASRLTNVTSDVPGYVELDARIGWQPREHWEVSLVGRNLLHDRHAEYGDPTIHFEVARSVFATVRWSY